MKGGVFGDGGEVHHGSQKFEIMIQVVVDGEHGQRLVLKQARVGILNFEDTWFSKEVECLVEACMDMGERKKFAKKKKCQRKRKHSLAAKLSHCDRLPWDTMNSGGHMVMYENWRRF